MSLKYRLGPTPPGMPSVIGNNNGDLAPGPWVDYVFSNSWCKGPGMIRELMSMTPRRELQTRNKMAEQIRPSFLGGACANCVATGNQRNRCSLQSMAIEDDATEPISNSAQQSLDFDLGPVTKRERQGSDQESEYVSSDKSLAPVLAITEGQDTTQRQNKRLKTSTTSSNEASTFRKLWVKLADVDHPPGNWDMHVSMGNLEKLRLDRSQNAVASRLVGNGLSASETDFLKNFLKKLPAKVQTILQDINSDEDTSAVRDAISYIEVLGEIKPKINAMKNGPVKDAYKNLFSHFDSFKPKPTTIGITQSLPTSKQTPGSTEITKSSTPTKPMLGAVEVTRDVTPYPSPRTMEAGQQLLRSFQQEGDRLRQEQDSRRHSDQAEVQEPHIDQKDVDLQLQRELDSQKPKNISRQRGVSLSLRKTELEK
ncbi:hypothetical protein PENANT_c002G01013 [Penicillium antarcticum]|uniref:Uncharacterized protein n=1 Tax=Penicillium antarcticum TaxID=416450 RepID=A0A1V6QKI3_9EURO|nr:hypothetical protein PENANT_c002G01013 [Penicillium antarcticum]